MPKGPKGGSQNRSYLTPLGGSQAGFGRVLTSFRLLLLTDQLRTPPNHPLGRVPGVIFDPILGPSFEGYMAKTPKVAPLNMGPPAKRGSKKVTILGHLGPSWEGPRQAWEGQNDHFWGPKIGWF